MSTKSFIFYESFRPHPELDDATRLALYDNIVSYGLTGEIAENLPVVVKAILAPILPTIDAATERYEKRGGRPRKAETVKNLSDEVSKPQKTVSKPIAEVSKPIDGGFSLNNNTNNNENINLNKNADADADENENSAQGTSSSSAATSERFSIRQEEFDAVKFLTNFWNNVAEKHTHLKSIELPSQHLRELVTSRYNELLTECDGNVTAAKNKLATVVINAAGSNWFIENRGKCTVNWIFKNWENFEKVLNGNFNDE